MSYRIIKDHHVLDGEIPYYTDPLGNILRFDSVMHCKIFLQLEGYLPEEIDNCTFEKEETHATSTG
jgi:hypothetical protein